MDELPVARISFDRTITLGSLLSIGSMLLTVASGVWLLSAQVTAWTTRLDALATQLQEMHASSDREIVALNLRLQEEARQRERMSDDVRDQIVRLNLRFDEWLRERRGELAAPGRGMN